MLYSLEKRTLEPRNLPNAHSGDISELSIVRWGPGPRRIRTSRGPDRLRRGYRDEGSRKRDQSSVQDDQQQPQHFPLARRECQSTFITIGRIRPPTTSAASTPLAFSTTKPSFTSTATTGIPSPAHGLQQRHSTGAASIFTVIRSHRRQSSISAPLPDASPPCA